MPYQYPLTNDEIKQFFAKPVHHGSFNKVHLHIQKAYKSFGLEPMSCYVVGASGVGKTMLAKTAKRMILEQTVPNKDAEITPVIMITFRSGAVPDQVRKDMLKKLKVDFSGYKNEDLEELLHKQLHVCGVRLVIFDEFQHLVRKYAKDVNKKACEFVKTFIDDTEIPVVLLGTPDGKKLFELFDELRTRFVEAGELVLMSCENKGSFEYFRYFIKELMANFPLETVDLSTDENIQRLMLATGGNLRVLKKLLIDVLGTNRDGQKKLVIEDYQKSYEFARSEELRRNTTKGGTRIIKPFTDKLNVVRKDLKFFQNRGFRNDKF